jgi:hypothetical protein
MNHAAVVLAYHGDGAGVAVMAKKKHTQWKSSF